MGSHWRGFLNPALKAPPQPPPTSLYPPPPIPCALARLHTRVQAHTEHWKETLSGVTRWGVPQPNPTTPPQPPPISLYPPPQNPLRPCTFAHACASPYITVQTEPEWGHMGGGVPTTQPCNPPQPPPMSIYPAHNPLRPCTFAHARARPEVTLGRQLEWGHMGGGGPQPNPTTPPNLPPYPFTPPQSLVPSHVCTRVCKPIHDSGKRT